MATVKQPYKGQREPAPEYVVGPYGPVAPVDVTSISASDIGNTARGLGLGLGLNYTDELEAQIRTLKGDETYEEELAAITRDYERFSDENPKTALAAELGGAFAPLALSMLLSGPTGGTSTFGPLANIGNIMQKATLAEKAKRFAPVVLNRLGPKTKGVLKNVGIGGGIGAVAATGDAPPGERLQQILPGALLGILPGVAVPAVSGTKTFLGNLWKKFRNKDSDAEDIALQKMTEKLYENEDYTDILAELALSEAQDVPIPLGGATPKLQAATGTLTKISDPEVTDFIEKGISKLSPEAARQRIKDRVVELMGGKDFYAEAAILQKNLNKVGAEGYREAYKLGVVDDPRINALLQTNTFQKVFEKAKDLAELDKTILVAQGGDPRVINFTDPDALPNVETLDYIKRGFDDIIDDAYTGKDGLGPAFGKKLKTLRDEFVDIVDEATTVGGRSIYKETRKRYGDAAELKKALEKGQQEFSKMDPTEIKIYRDKLSEAGKSLFTVGAGQNILDDLAKSPETIDAAKRLIRTEGARERLEVIFPDITPGGYDLLEATLKNETKLYNFSKEVTKRINSARNRQAGDFFLSGDSGKNVVQAPTISNFLQNIFASLEGKIIPEKAQKIMAEMLMEGDPDEIAAVVKAVDIYVEEAGSSILKNARNQNAATIGLANIAATKTGATYVNPETSEEERLDIEDLKARADSAADRDRKAAETLVSTEADRDRKDNSKSGKGSVD